MLLTAISCPQCGGTLPKAARWMVVSCPHCGSKVSANKQVVRRDAYIQACARLWEAATARAALDPSAQMVKVGDRVVRLRARLARGENSEVFVGERVGPFAERYTVKIALNETAVDAKHCFGKAIDALDALQRNDSVATGPFFTLCLPQVVAYGTDHLRHAQGRAVLLLRHPADYWGSLAQVLAFNPGGIDARHVVWMWSRCIDIAGYVHACGQTHGALSLDHLLVQSHDHSMIIIGWGHAEAAALHSSSRAGDLSQLAWAMRRLVSMPDSIGSDMPPALREDVPAPLAKILRLASEDHDWLRHIDARQLRERLMQAAAASFGPRKFVHFNPRAAATAAQVIQP